LSIAKDNPSKSHRCLGQPIDFFRREKDRGPSVGRRAGLRVLTPWSPDGFAAAPISGGGHPLRPGPTGL